MHPVVFVDEQTNARWEMQFFWPLKLEYVISYLDVDYQNTIIGRSKRDYAWIMSRDQQVSEDKYESLKQELVKLGYNLENLRKMPQQ